MRTHNDIYKTNQKYRNSIRLAEYKLRRQEFVENLSKTPDNDYSTYYGADVAGYIDAREWWEYQNEDKDFIEKHDINFLKKQAF